MSKRSSRNGYEFPTYSLSVSFLNNKENRGKKKVFYFLQKMTKELFMFYCNAVISICEDHRYTICHDCVHNKYYIP